MSKATARTAPAWRVAILLTALLGLVPGARASDDTDEELASLRNAVEVLTEEVRRIRDDEELPRTDRELASYGGLGPAASKVYGSTPGLSLGGYGEFYFAAPTDDESAVRVADFYRFITYVGYKFTDRILMNTELEFEHATTSSNASGQSGSVSVEFSYLDFLLSETANVRAGNLLVPVGFVNRMHEPPFYRGNFRPTLERTILPSTWRELGAGLHGRPAPGVRYEAYLVNGLDASRFGSSGVRDGRQSGGRARWENLAVVVSADVDVAAAATLGGSIFTGNSDQGRTYDGTAIDARTTIAEAHGEVRHQGFRGRALIAKSSIGDVEEISAEVGATVPEAQVGWYVEGAYDVAPYVSLPADQSLLVWIRYEDLSLHSQVATDATPDPSLEQSSVAVGVEYFPHPQVVLKADWTFQDDEGDGPQDDPFRFGAGFVY